MMRLISFCVLVFPIVVFCQNKEELKNQKKAIEKEISYTSSLLKKTKENKKTSLQYISYLNKKIGRHYLNQIC